jgi:isoleucyl-tRNA synthetase
MPESVHMLSWPETEQKWHDEVLEGDMQIAKEIIEVSYAARQAARIKIRQPLRRLRVVSEKEQVNQALQRLMGVVLEQTNVKDVEIITAKEEEEMKSVKLVPNRAVLGPIFKQKSGKVATLIEGLEGRTTLEALNRGAVVTLNLDGEEIELRREYMSVKELPPENFKGTDSKYGKVYVDTTIDKNLMAEGLMRDIVRRVQEMRKKANLKVDAYINLTIQAPNTESTELLKGRSRQIASEVRAKTMEVRTGGVLSSEIVEEWEIEGERFMIGINSLSDKNEG